MFTAIPGKYCLQNIICKSKFFNHSSHLYFVGPKNNTIFQMEQ